jgi:hypothetical protein
MYFLKKFTNVPLDIFRSTQWKVFSQEDQKIQKDRAFGRELECLQCGKNKKLK